MSEPREAKEGEEEIDNEIDSDGLIEEDEEELRMRIKRSQIIFMSSWN